LLLAAAVAVKLRNILAVAAQAASEFSQVNQSQLEIQL
jgi:hypothetical protein